MYSWLNLFIPRKVTREEDESFVNRNPDGSVSLDPYAGKSRKELKKHCGELCSALTYWQYAAMSAATDAGNQLQNVREPYRSKIARLIEACSDEDDTPPSPPSDGKQVEKRRCPHCGETGDHDGYCGTC